MYLKRLEVQGFKTFAQKTTLEFPPESADRHHLTVVVGPNGSGKSNLADAIRWCLGEQSLKLLRGKKAEDVIFSGSEGKSRSGFAEVSLTFDNADKTMHADYSEVTITRRLYRDGESGYMLNGKDARLSDIQLLLAESGVGQRSYSVIGQGMVDHVLTATPEERKVFFADAMGVRSFQMKRHQAMLKLQKSAENLSEAEMLLGELEPRIASLKRQVDRLQKRAAVEEELKTVQDEYYSGAWWTLANEKTAVAARHTEARQRIAKKQEELKIGDARLAEMEKQEAPKADNSGLQPLQEAYKAAQQGLADARKAHFAAEREMELAKVRSQSTWAPMSLSDIVVEIGGITEVQQSLAAKLRAAKSMDEVTAIADEVDGVFGRSKKLRERLTKPNPEDFTPSKEHVAAIEGALSRVKTSEAKVKETEAAMDAFAKQSTAQKSEVFAFQRQLRALQQELFGLEQSANAVQIELTRVETRMEAIEKEMKDDVGGERAAAMKKTLDFRLETLDVTALHEKMIRLKHQLELIGGIDEEVMKEYATTNERFTFLTSQVKDLRDAIRSTEKIIDELDGEIRAQSEKAFSAINKEFQRYFKVLFGGGSCSLVKMTQEDVENDTKINLDRAMEEMAEEKQEAESVQAITARVAERKEAVAGVDIQATPPGKKLKALNLLSGGERALTSMALISAIMATNPSPFVVLDEVDAALDEANTVRFSNILQELQKLTQFIVITHNRATMEKADMLYGVTMGGDGVSKLLSVKLDEIGEGGARR